MSFVHRKPRQPSPKIRSDGKEEYVIFPRGHLTSEEIDQTDSAIRKIVGPDAESAIGKFMANGGTVFMFWNGPLNEDQVAQIAKLEEVKEVKKDEWDPDITYG